MILHDDPFIPIMQNASLRWEKVQTSCQTLDATARMALAEDVTGTTVPFAKVRTDISMCFGDEKHFMPLDVREDNPCECFWFVRGRKQFLFEDASHMNGACENCKSTDLDYHRTYCPFRQKMLCMECYCTSPTNLVHNRDAEYPHKLSDEDSLLFEATRRWFIVMGEFIAYDPTSSFAKCVRTHNGETVEGMLVLPPSFFEFFMIVVRQNRRAHSHVPRKRLSLAFQARH